MWNSNPRELIHALEKKGLRRAYVIRGGAGGLMASDPVLEPLAKIMSEHPDYFDHQGAFFEIGSQSGHLLSAFVHNTTRGQAAGGVRFWCYDQLSELFTDGLRLSRGMGQKCALAGLWWGGGKGVIARRDDVDHKDPAQRAKIFADYGHFISGLSGVYVTAEDVGTTPPDMARIFTTTRHTTCVPPELGGSGNPSQLTALGVVMGLEAGLDFAGMGSFEGKTVAMQGLGNVASFMLRMLFDRKVARVIGCDVDEEVVERVKRQFVTDPLETQLVELGDTSILAEDVDVLIPNATGAVLNPETIPQIRAKVVGGAANNQLAETRRDGHALIAREILYVPDFLCNRMGIVNCANEQYGWLPNDPAIQAHLTRDAKHGVFQRTLEVLGRSRDSGKCPAEEAEQLADELMLKPHPIWPERCKQIIGHLVESGWASH